MKFLFLHEYLQASAACIALVSNKVVWSGVQYVKKGGKVHFFLYP
jgi:hypothetical protein